MYRFVSEIINDQSSSFVPDVAFHPDGSMFAVSYKNNNQIRVYDSSTQSLLRTYRNPEARLDWPHGVTMTNRHIIVSNKHNPPTKPSTFNVYRVGDPSLEPLTVFTTPVKHLREAHSLAVHNGRLLATYCAESIGSRRAIVSYRFDDEEGKISGPTSILESCFIMQRNPKGLCFNEEGTKVIVTLTKAELTKPGGFEHSVKEAMSAAVERSKEIADKLRIRKFLRRTRKFVLSKLANSYIGQNKKSDKTIDDSYGVAIFDVDEDGVLSKAPVQTLLGSQFSRPENVSIAKGLCAITNLISETVNLYNFDGDHFPDFPVQVIRDRLSFPHDACLSPDKKMLVVANYGLGVINGEPQWGSFHHPRSDKLTFYELQE